MIQLLTLLGSTGSIGTQTLDVVRRHPSRFQVVGLSARTRISELAAQIAEFHPRLVAVARDADRRALLSRLSPPHPEVVVGEEGLVRLAGMEDADIAVVATVGRVGLRPTFAALKRGRRVALANKEVLVMAGALVMDEARRHGARVVPIDSEHSALLQCLGTHDPDDVRRILLTASGGPFRDADRAAMEDATLDDALAHPTWDMGAKITIDSATLMNKGLEVIEAHHLFDIDFDRIQVVIHPQSIVHSLVEFIDGSVVAQLGLPDMRVPIQYALTWPDRLPGGEAYLDLLSLGGLSFHAPDLEKFPCLALAYQVGREGGTLPTVFSVAGEVANEAFREGRLRFMEIPRLIERALEAHDPIVEPSLEQILEVEAETWDHARSLL